MTHSYADIAQWIVGAFPVRSKRGDELSFPCPICDHDSCYFNIKKQLGYCHRASCHTTFTFDSLVDLIGYGPELAGYIPMMDKKEKPVTPVVLPKGAVPIINGTEVEALALRGVTYEMIQKFNIHTNKTHIIVPIYEEGNLVQYNSRRVNKDVRIGLWFSALGDGVKRYTYAQGHPITNYFLGWEECRLWERIVLVENTFVSMRLRYLNCTTNFGSYLSDTHINKIIHSNIKHVTFLWDENTEISSQKAQRKLKAFGIPSQVIHIKGQPDEYSNDVINDLING